MHRRGKTERGLTQRERRLLGALARGETYAEAARRAGYKARHLRQAGFQAFQAVKEKMPQILNRLGLTDDVVIDKYLRPALEARETVFAKFRGKICDRRSVIAWGPRLAALDILFKLKGSYADWKEKVRSEKMEVLPDEFVRAINYALGVTGELIPLKMQPEGGEGGEGSEPVIDVDILPQG